MSIEKMISEHPDVAGHLNEPLAKAVRHAMYCAAICNSCADACAAEENVAERRDCIRQCLDCADICTATYRIATRRTGSNEKILRATLQLCAEACEDCAEMCSHHGDAHCKRCAEMCRECAEDCRKAGQNL
ncbi:four-helix bundle copper-binding protein [Sulfitobacter aestuarii]|uniref:Four-helix bundle copper-binding protein n=1 Tax=Sulfitobacter aestuarii TaxID=2161676 RepID=A0ABW5U1L3_9RHOB